MKQEPKSKWVKCSERVPRHMLRVQIRYAPLSSHQNEGWRDACEDAWFGDGGYVLKEPYEWYDDAPLLTPEPFVDTLSVVSLSPEQRAKLFKVFAVPPPNDPRLYSPCPVCKSYDAFDSGLMSKWGRALICQKCHALFIRGPDVEATPTS